MQIKGSTYAIFGTHYIGFSKRGVINANGWNLTLEMKIHIWG
jgi:hypothetical protein